MVFAHSQFLGSSKSSQNHLGETQSCWPKKPPPPALKFNLSILNQPSLGAQPQVPYSRNSKGAASIARGQQCAQGNSSPPTPSAVWCSRRPALLREASPHHHKSVLLIMRSLDRSRAWAWVTLLAPLLALADTDAAQGLSNGRQILICLL